MKSKLGQIAIGLFVVSSTAFDLIATYENVHLNIVYFSVMYACFMLFSLNEHFRFNGSISFKIGNFSFSLVMGIGFAVRIAWELTKWNLNFDEYMTSVNNYEQGLLISFLIISLLLIPITNARKYRNNSDDNG